MQMWSEIRRRVLVEGVSKRSVCRDHGIAHKTLQKILANTEPPGYRKSAPRAKTKLEPFLPVIEEILVRDRDAPPKQRHTAKRIFERLRDEYGYSGGITQVLGSALVPQTSQCSIAFPCCPSVRVCDRSWRTSVLSGDPEAASDGVEKFARPARSRGSPVA